MLTSTEYVRQSIETNLFFLRIMKEHLIFAAAALTLKDSNQVPAIMNIKNKFEALLINTISLARGVVRPQSLAAGDIITPYTYNAEIATQNYTGLPINTEITRQEAALSNTSSSAAGPMIEQSVNTLNRQIIVLLATAIQTQRALITNVLSCKMFTNMYPLMMEHVTREAEHYLQHLQTLQSYQSLTDGPRTAAIAEIFWNNIMGEHSKFIRGLLDPTEEDLIQKANGFAGQFDELLRAARAAYNNLQLSPGVTRRSMSAAINIRNFKAQGTQGILACKIRSIILPLLSDHVLREANHYLKELREFKM
ncbi:MAG: DUF2935 domain-containing protein [Bacillota bacterium]|nr:DUF2935 domain-containing protein [Bacillota bacterium]